jgi:hypothetical protein
VVLHAGVIRADAWQDAKPAASLLQEAVTVA